MIVLYCIHGYFCPMFFALSNIKSIHPACNLPRQSMIKRTICPLTIKVRGAKTKQGHYTVTN